MAPMLFFCRRRFFNGRGYFIFLCGRLYYCGVSLFVLFISARPFHCAIYFWPTFILLLSLLLAKNKKKMAQEIIMALLLLRRRRPAAAKRRRIFIAAVIIFLMPAIFFSIGVFLFRRQYFPPLIKINASAAYRRRFPLARACARPLFFINLGGLYFFLFIYFARPFISLKNPFLFISGAVFYFWARFLFFLPLFSWPKNKGR